MEFSNYKPGDTVVATVNYRKYNNCHRYNPHDDCYDIIHKGETDTIESVSSNHHGGLQLNLVKHGRGWSNHVWRKNCVEPLKENIVDIHSLEAWNGTSELYFTVEIDTSMSGVGGWSRYGEPGYGKIEEAQTAFVEAKATTFNRVRVVAHFGIVVADESGNASGG